MADRPSPRPAHTRHPGPDDHTIVGDQWLPCMRDPDEETEDYPGLIVHDGRVTGSITLERSRLPVWAFSGCWDTAEEGWGREAAAAAGIDHDGLYGWTRGRWYQFLHNLLEHRGDLARLLCVLADAQRQQDSRFDDQLDRHYREHHGDRTDDCDHAHRDYGWWEYADLRGRVVDVLRRCLESLDPGSVVYPAAHEPDLDQEHFDA